MISEKVIKFQLAQKIYMLVSIITLAILILLLGIIQAVGATFLVDLPIKFAHIVIGLFWFNLAHFTYGIYQLIRYYTVIKKIQPVSLIKTIISLILSPIIFFIVYILFIIAVFVSCASNT